MNRDQMGLKAAEVGVPDHMIDELMLYIFDGIEPGGFLTAVLENNLMESFGRADQINRFQIFRFCDFLYNHAPLACYGNPEKVSKWLELGGINRLCQTTSDEAAQ